MKYLLPLLILVLTFSIRAFAVDFTADLTTDQRAADSMHLFEGNNESPAILNIGAFEAVSFMAQCAYSLSNSGTSIRASGGTGSVSVIAGTGCNWTAVSNVSWISITSGSNGSGNGTVSFSVAANNGPARTGTITIAGQTFTVTQASGCTFTLPSETIQFPSQGGSGSFSVTTSNACSWTATTTASWITITSGAGTGNGTVSFTVAAYFSGGGRNGMIFVNGQSFTIEQDGELQPPPRRTLFDFDGDGKSDFSIYRPNVGEWWYLRSSDGGNHAFQFGTASDKIVPADYTGDGKTDFAFYRPEKGEWFILRSEDFSYYSFPFGLDKDLPVSADYDGDGKADAAVYRPSTSFWYILKSTGGVMIQQFGTGEDIPVPADYNGDGKADIAVYNRSISEWLVYYGNSVSIDSLFRENTNKPVPADYTGDGKADIALYDTLTNEWYVIRSENQTTYSVRFGAAEDIPAPGDYDGDGITDYAIYRPSTATWWYAASSANNQHRARQFGIGTDLPVPSAYIR